MRTFSFSLPTQGTTSVPSVVQVNNPGAADGQAFFARVRVCDLNGYANATNATIAAASGCTVVETHTATKDLTFKSSPAAKATGVLTISSVVIDGETVTIGPDVYEFDTHTASTITSGRIRANISASAVKAQGTLRLDTIPTANDLFTIGARTYVCVASGAGDSAGEVSIGASLAAFEANLLAAIAGTDGFNSAHPTVTMAVGTPTAGTVTLTSDNTNVANTETVTIGNKVYTFKTALTPTEGEVLIGGSADASLLNLINAINHTGTPNTDYKCAAAHTQVTAASAVTAHAFVLTALTTNSAAVQNALASTETSAHLSFGAATFTGALDKYVITALAGGVAGNSLVTTETFTPGNNTFDAATLGTTTAGVDCSATNAGIALAAAITANALSAVSAAQLTGTVTVTATSFGTLPNAVATTEAMANGSWAAVTLAGGTDNAPNHIKVTLTDATAEAVTVRMGPPHLSPLKETDFSATMNVTHAA